MSKASEWAARAEKIQQQIDALDEQRGELEFKIAIEDEGGRKGTVTAFVIDDASMHIGAYDATLSYAQALTFARWILDTFGDEAPR